MTKLVTLMSGGIDSPVAAYLMSEVGAEVLLLHMDNRPYTDDFSIVKTARIAKQLVEFTGRDFPLYVAEHGKSQTAIKEKCGYYQCVMCKRTMISVAIEFAKRNGCSGIVMGDSMGQVASQTLMNMRSETVGIDFPVLRPLIGLDKIEIEAIAKKIGTYEISILKDAPCGVVPSKPATAATAEKVLEYHAKIDLPRLVEDSVSSISRNPCTY